MAPPRPPSDSLETICASEPTQATEEKPRVTEARLDDFRLALASARKANLERIAEYRRRGRFPVDDKRTPDGVARLGHRLFRRPVFIDQHGTSCAVAFLMQAAGRSKQAEDIAKANVHVKVEEVEDGPLFEWVLRSGFTQEEVALVQPEYARIRAEALLARRRETERLVRHFARIERQLTDNAEIALDVALSRIKARILDGRVTIEEIA
jgi:hypothetical protein